MPSFSFWNIRTNVRQASGSLCASWANSNEHLAVVATEIGLDKALTGKLEGSTSLSSKNLGTTMEALLGAIHEDSGKDPRPVRHAMSRMGLLVSFKEIMRRRQSIKDLSKQLKYDEKLGSQRALRNSKDLEDAETDADADQELLDASIDELKKEIVDGNSRRQLMRQARSQAKMKAKMAKFEKRSPRLSRLHKFGSPGAPSADRKALDDADAEQEDLEEGDAVRENFDLDIDQELLDAQWSAGDMSEQGSLIGSDGTAMEPRGSKSLRHDPEWHQHQWVPQHCQITLEVAQSGRMIRRKS